MPGCKKFAFLTWLFFSSLLLIQKSKGQSGTHSLDTNSAIQHAASSLQSTLEEIEYNTSLHPSHTDQITGEWVKEYMGREEWTSGFFAGSLWNMYQLTGNDKWRLFAADWTEDLEPMSLGATDHDTGFRIFTSFGTGYALTDNLSYSRTIQRGAQTLTTRFNSDIGAIKSWDWIGNFPVIIDNLMNLEILFWAAAETGNIELYNTAVTHAETSLEHHMREDGSTYHVVDFDDAGNVNWKDTRQGYGPESVWARGQAWAIYGFTMIHRYTGEQKYLDAAKKASTWFIDNLPDDFVPIYDFLEPVKSVQTKDASAAAVAASAFLELYQITGQNLYIKTAEQILSSLSSDKYSTRTDSQNSILKRSTLHRGKGKLGTSYADYYYLEAIVRYLKINGGALPEINNHYAFFLGHNFPNPFRDRTTIYYSVSENSFVKVELYNTVGQKIRTMVSEMKQPGNYRINLQATSLSPGIYFCTLTSAGRREVKKITVIR